MHESPEKMQHHSEVNGRKQITDDEEYRVSTVVFVAFDWILHWTNLNDFSYCSLNHVEGTDRSPGSIRVAMQRTYKRWVNQNSLCKGIEPMVRQKARAEEVTHLRRRQYLDYWSGNHSDNISRWMSSLFDQTKRKRIRSTSYQRIILLLRILPSTIHGLRQSRPQLERERQRSKCYILLNDSDRDQQSTSHL